MTAQTDREDAPSVEDLRRESLGGLLSRLGDDSALLVRQEIALAQTEFKEKAVAAGIGVALLVVGAFMLLAVLGAGTTAAVAGFRLLLPLWAAALCTLGAFALAAVMFAVVGLGRLKAAAPPAPQRAIQVAKETPGELIR
jgi:hypothetical protein